MGWRVFRIWEHELKRKNERRLRGRLRRAGVGLAWRFPCGLAGHGSEKRSLITGALAGGRALMRADWLLVSVWSVLHSGHA